MRILGLDFGLRRIGVAISDSTGSMAYPLTVIEKQNEDIDIQRIAHLIDEYDVGEVIVGLPVSLTGQIGPQARIVLEYVEKLRVRLEIPVKTWDERLTTSAAERTLTESGVKRARRKEVVDKIAAAIILQSYIDSRKPRS